MVITFIRHAPCINAMVHISCVGHADRLRMCKLLYVEDVPPEAAGGPQGPLLEKLWQDSSLIVSTRPVGHMDMWDITLTFVG